MPLNPYIKKMKNYFYWRVHDGIQLAKNYLALAITLLSRRRALVQKPHGLPYDVIVTLTSYKPRFKTLPFTLECLLRQSVKADKIIVWIDEPDVPFITDELRQMQTRGVEIHVTPQNFGPFNKIVHTLKAFPQAIIVTVDDDIFYRKDMLSNLIKCWSGDVKEIVYHYGCQISVDAKGNKLPFNNWKAAPENYFPGYDVVAYGFAGVLYPPGSLPLETIDDAIFKKLCPKADDMWLYWMGRNNGSVYRRTSNKTFVAEWPSSQQVGLKHNNTFSGNDDQINNLVNAYGWPSFDRR